MQHCGMEFQYKTMLSGAQLLKIQTIEIEVPVGGANLGRLGA